MSVRKLYSDSGVFQFKNKMVLAFLGCDKPVGVSWPDIKRHQEHAGHLGGAQE